jgi:uncharacterized membrane-anchored protein
MADFADRSLSIGYPGGSSILFLLVVSSLVVWKMTVGTVSVNNIVEPRVEMYYWLTILLLSNTLGTALGDWTSEGTGFGGGRLSVSWANRDSDAVVLSYEHQPHVSDHEKT